MFKRLVYFLLIFFSILFSSCDILKQAPKYQFADGYYKTNKFHNKAVKVYIDNSEDIITIYPLKENGNQYKLDSLPESVKIFPSETIINTLKSQYFRQQSFDVDFLTLPVKYRFSTASFPNQLNTNINGAVYFGYRTDV